MPCGTRLNKSKLNTQNGENMAKCINVKWNNEPCYDIKIEDSWDSLKSSLEEFDIKSKKVCIVTESNVGPFYAKEIRSIIEDAASKVILFEIPAGEKSKNLSMINELYEVLIKEKFDRSDMLVALGGGVIGDMTGFAAATYLRGIDFIQIPTSLLAQVDSSVGGKTGVDFKGYKNMVGAFKQPKLVYINLHTLETLNKREFLSGMGEVIKYGAINDVEFIDWLDKNTDNIKNFNTQALEYMISKCCDFKREVVENDFTEKGERAFLNFGHTIGHAVEKAKDFSLLHGECVAIGMNAALKISLDKGKIDNTQYEKMLNVIKSFELPTTVSGITCKEVFEGTLHDKKMQSGKIKFILVDGIGKAYMDTELSEMDIEHGIESILE